MNRYHARDLLNMSREQLWALPEEWHVVVFDDGELITHTRATITSVYGWYPIMEFPDTPMLMDFHLGDRRFTSKLQLKMLNRVIWAIHDASGERANTERLAYLAFDAMSRFYNDFTTRLSAYVATLSMFDMLEVMYHPEIKAANEEVEPTQHSIEDVCYPRIKNTLLDPNELIGNPIAEASKSGTLKMGQTLQCVGPVGYRTDIHSGIFQHPILKSFTEGVDDLYGAMIESRSGAKSLLYNKELLRGTEYFNRKTQLVAQYVQRLHHVDCGTPHTIDFPVLKDTLKQMTGKYYVREDGALDWLRGNEEHLIGHTIKLRSVISCVHPDPQGICSVCYGRLSFSIPENTNIGQVSAVSMGDKITSSVLSTKHLDSTSRVEKFVLRSTEREFLCTPKDDETLYLRKHLHNKKKWIVVVREEVKNLADIIMLPDLAEYPATNASQLTQMQIIVDEGPKGQRTEVLTVSLYNRKSSFSRELLEYIRKERWINDDMGNVVIDISSFDVEKPFLTLPFKHVNMYEVMTRIQTFLHSGSDTENKKLDRRVAQAEKQKLKAGEKAKPRQKRNNFLKSYRDPTAALVVFYQMLNEKLSINLVHCEILVYAMMVRSPAQRDYRLPIPGVHGSFEKYNTLMMSRSLAAAMAYEKQDRPLITPGSFIYTHRNDHPYDLLLMGGAMS